MGKYAPSDGPEVNDQDADTYVDLLVRYSARLNTLIDELDSLRWRSLITSYVAVMGSALILLGGAYLASQSNLGTLVWTAVLGGSILLIALIISLVVGFVLWNQRRRVVLLSNQRVAFRQLQRVAAIASQAEEHTVHDSAKRLALEMSLFEAESALRRAKGPSLAE
jgi:hypothetical protein